MPPQKETRSGILNLSGKRYSALLVFREIHQVCTLKVFALYLFWKLERNAALYFILKRFLVFYDHDRPKGIINKFTIA